MLEMLSYKPMRILRSLVLAVSCRAKAKPVGPRRFKASPRQSKTQLPLSYKKTVTCVYT